MMNLEQQKAKMQTSRSEMLAAIRNRELPEAHRTEAKRRLSILDGCLRKNRERLDRVK